MRTVVGVAVLRLPSSVECDGYASGGSRSGSGALGSFGISVQAERMIKRGIGRVDLMKCTMSSGKMIGGG
jgi:hypothetical protein